MSDKQCEADRIMAESERVEWDVPSMPSFGKMLQNTIDGNRSQNKERAQLMRVYNRLLKLVDNVDDPFWFEYDGFKFTELKVYRGSDRVHLRDARPCQLFKA